jgi:hypothetical protein
MPRVASSRLVRAVAAAASAIAVVACETPGRVLGPDDGGVEPCERGCPPSQQCHYGEGTCIHAGIANCADCADGLVCSPAYPTPTCVKGTCEAQSSFSTGAVKIVRLAVASLERGCDLDGDGDPDNQLADIQKQIDLSSELQAAIDTDRATVLLEPSDASWGAITLGGGADPYSVALWFGTLGPDSVACSPSALDAFCTYTVSRASYDPATLEPTCAPWLEFDDVRAEGAALASPSPGPALDMVIPLDPGRWLLQLLGARLEATAFDALVEGEGLAPRLEGRLCAAVPKVDLLLAVDTLPPETIAKFGGKSVVRDYVDAALEADLDASGDGEADSVSMALEWTAIPARIVGYSPDE